MDIVVAAEIEAVDINKGVEMEIEADLIGRVTEEVKEEAEMNDEVVEEVKEEEFVMTSELRGLADLVINVSSPMI